MPAPRISSQPVFLQTRHPLPRQITQAISTSALGSVKGKKLGRRRTPMSLAEHLVRKDSQYPLEVAKSYPLIDHQTFNLMKHWRVGGIVITAVDRARGNDPYRRLLLEHCPDLNR